VWWLSSAAAAPEPPSPPAPVLAPPPALEQVLDKQDANNVTVVTMVAAEEMPRLSLIAAVNTDAASLHNTATHLAKPTAIIPGVALSRTCPQCRVHHVPT